MEYISNQERMENENGNIIYNIMMKINYYLGVGEVTAEAELLSAIITFFK
jgi:hypothetical protein